MSDEVQCLVNTNTEPAEPAINFDIKEEFDDMQNSYRVVILCNVALAMLILPRQGVLGDTFRTRLPPVPLLVAEAQASA